MNAQGVDLMPGTELNKTELLKMFDTSKGGGSTFKKRIARSFIKDYKPEDFYVNLF